VRDAAGRYSNASAYHSFGRQGKKSGRVAELLRA
jgi:hypothetical protein